MAARILNILDVLDAGPQVSRDLSLVGFSSERGGLVCLVSLTVGVGAQGQNSGPINEVP